MLTFCSILALTAHLPPDVENVVAANNQFACQLYHKLQNADGNIFFSPYSVNKTLRMATAGACGDTAREMAAVLHCSTDPRQQAEEFRQARLLLNGPSQPFLAKPLITAKKHKPELYLATDMWVQRNSGCETAFLKLLEHCYGASARDVDFANPDATRRSINTTVAKQTRNHVQTLLSDGVLSPTSRLVLTSAIYVNGHWPQAFKTGDTKIESFWSTGSHESAIPMMHGTVRSGYFIDNEIEILELPYEGGQFALLVLSPRKRDGLAQLESRLGARTMADWASSLRYRDVRVALPKFTIHQQRSLVEPLMSMGIKQAFRPDQADFSSINAGREQLFLSGVWHQAFVEVNEEGTQAAAATAASFDTLSAQPTLPEFRADHPFLFAIRDVQTGTILFLGRFQHP